MNETEDLVKGFLDGWVERLRHLHHRIKDHTGREDFKQEMMARRDAQLLPLYSLAVAYYGYRPETLLTVETDARTGGTISPGILRVFSYRSDRLFTMCDAGACSCGTIPVRDELPQRSAISA
jgi:hypothetical protein